MIRHKNMFMGQSWINMTPKIASYHHQSRKIKILCTLSWVDLIKLISSRRLVRQACPAVPPACLWPHTPRFGHGYPGDKSHSFAVQFFMKKVLFLFSIFSSTLRSGTLLKSMRWSWIQKAAMANRVVLSSRAQVGQINCLSPILGKFWNP